MKKILILVLSTFSLFSMEQPDTIQQPVIVNYNEGDQLPKEVTSAVIFGSTPRISQLHVFTELVAHDIDEIIRSKPKGMRKELKKLKQEKPDILLKMLHHFKVNQHSDTAIECFLKHGINKKLFLENINALRNNANRCPNAQNLINVFLPIYFSKEDFKDISLEEQKEILKRFFVHSAQLHKRLHQEQKSQQAVQIVIPPIENFVDLPSAQEAKDKGDNMVVTILKTCLLDKGVKKATLLNPSERELVEFGKKFQKMGYSPEDIQLRKMTIYAGLEECKIFTPYTIPAGKIPSALLSCVVSKDLVETFEQLEQKK